MHKKYLYIHKINNSCLSVMQINSLVLSLKHYLTNYAVYEKNMLPSYSTKNFRNRICVLVLDKRKLNYTLFNIFILKFKIYINI